MIILPYGIEQPTTGDRGSVFFPILERGLQRLSSHDHDGVNSALISAAHSSAGTVLLPSGSWVLVSPGLYSQTVNLPVNFDYDNTSFEVRLNDASQETIYADIAKVTATSIIVYAATNTLNYKLICK